MRFWPTVIIIALFLFQPFPVFSGATDTGVISEKRILLLYSFTINFAPDFQLASAFNRTISESSLKLRVKHLELNAFAPEDATDEALSAKIEPLLPDIRRGDYDVIIPIGQIAIDLLLRHCADIPEKTAIAFCGLDIVTKELFMAHPNTTGALGRVSVADNIELGLHFFPDTRRIILLTDWSVQGKRILEAGKHYEASYPGIEYIYPDNASTGLNEMLNLVGKQDGHTMVLFYAWYNRDSTNLASLQYIMAHLERSAAPVFALQEPMLWEGALGGIYTEVEPIGVALAGQVERILRGSKASEITIAALPLKTVVNWSAVQNGRIEKFKIPVAAEVIGGNTIFKEENYPILIVSGVSLLVVVGLLMLISALFFRLKRVTRLTEAVLRHIPGRIIVSDRQGRLLFLHSGDMNCDGSNADLRLGAMPGYYDETIREAAKQVFATGKPLRFEHEFDKRQYSVEIVKFSSGIFRVDAVLWVLTDIDELSQTRRKLDEALRKSQLTLDSVADSVIVTDEKANITYLNPAASAMFGHGQRTAIGCPVDELFDLRPDKDIADEEEFSLKEAIRNEVSMTQRYNYTLCVPGRKPRDVIFNLSPVVAGNASPVGSVLTIRDITPLKEYQNRLLAAMKEAQNANQAKSLFLSTMSHELRTPLNAVIGFSEVLQQSDLPESERREYLSSISFAGTTLLNLINDILDLSKIEAGQMVLTPRPTDVVKLCCELAKLFKPITDKKGIDISVEFPVAVPMLALDEMRLRQILLNLAGNAVKFTEKGGVVLKVEFTAGEPGVGDIAIHVIDTGVGIRKDAQKRVFEPFEQQDADRDSRVFKGTGLGLAISNRLAKHMGGMIVLDSSEGLGSDFTLVLNRVPVLSANDASGAGARPESEPAGASGRSCRVLLVDDVPMNLKVLQAMLRKLGVEAVTAGSAREALSMMHRECPDVVLTDLWMPGVNGREFAHEIRSVAAFSGVRIFAVTADAETGKDNFSADFDGIVYKPLSFEKLQKLMGELGVGAE